MSAMSVYRWVGRSASSGSTISSNLRQLRDVGALPVDSAVNKTLLSAHGLDPSKTHPPRGYSKRFPTEWKETAKNFRALEWFDIASFEGIITALFMDFPVVYGRASHSICGVEPVYRNRTWNIKYANSWGEWGENGFGYDTEAFVSRAIRSYGAWCLRAIHIPEAFNAIPPLTT